MSEVYGGPFDGMEVPDNWQEPWIACYIPGTKRLAIYQQTDDGYLFCNTIEETELGKCRQ